MFLTVKIAQCVNFLILNCCFRRRGYLQYYRGRIQLTIIYLIRKSSQNSLIYFLIKKFFSRTSFKIFKKKI